jgi:hypothetical protein
MLSNRLKDAIADDHKLGDVLEDTMKELLSDDRAIPVYRSDIKTEAQANTAPDLPLLYIWNEVVTNGRLVSFSLSTSGKVIGTALERRLPRAHPLFGEIRDFIADAIREPQVKTIMEVCAKIGKSPSALYVTRPG